MLNSGESGELRVDDGTVAEGCGPEHVAGGEGAVFVDRAKQ